MLSGNKVSKI